MQVFQYHGIENTNSPSICLIEFCAAKHFKRDILTYLKKFKSSLWSINLKQSLIGHANVVIFLLKTDSKTKKPSTWHQKCPFGMTYNFIKRNAKNNEKISTPVFFHLKIKEKLP